MYFFLSAGIGNTLTGIEHAILKRKTIFDACGLAHKIITTNFNANYIKNLTTHRIGQNSFLNLYDDYQNIIFKQNQENKIDHFLSRIVGHIQKKNVAGTRDIRVYVDDLHMFYISRYEDGQIAYINYFDQHKNKYKREIYSSNGYLSQTIFLENNQKRWVSYHNDSAQVVIEEHFDQQQNPVLFVVKRNNQSHFFHSKDQWLSFWFERLIKNNPNSVFYSDKNRIYNPILIPLKNETFKLVSVFHSMHFRNAKDIMSTLNSNYRACLNQAEAFDGFIVSTEHQKQDLVARYGEQMNIWVIPPTYAAPLAHQQPQDSAQTFKVISVGRYYIEKRLDHIIQAVALLAEKYPFIQLDLFGFGDSRDNFAYEKKIRKMVVDQHLEQIVKFRGYVHNIAEQIRQADVSVVTSTVEGFCIGVLDSLAVGTPVVAYDIKYGPRAMIKHGTSGFLVEEANIQQLAAALEQIYLHAPSSDAVQMSTQPFSFAVQKKKWLDHLFDLSEKSSN